MPARPNAPTRSLEATRQTWADRLARFAYSALTVVAFCERERVSAPSFYYWKHRLGTGRPAARSDAAPLIPVRLTAGPTPVELVLPGGAVLRLTPGCDLDFVRSLLAALGAAPC